MDHHSRPQTGSARSPSHGQAASTIAGRGRELGVLRERIAAAALGTGSVVLLDGEPGIGKTHIARALTAEVQVNGGIAIWGRGFEAAWSPPYGVWIDALTDLYHGRTPEQVCDTIEGLGPVGAPLYELLPIAPNDSASPPRQPGLDQDEERYRAHEAVVRALTTAAADRPLLVVLDDLQWADPASLGLLLHLTRALPRAGIVVLATLRDVPLDREARSSHLTTVLSALHRDPSYVRLAIGGLDQAEVATMLTEVAARPVSAALSGAVLDETGGNPFYAAEVMRHLLDEDRLVAGDGGWSAELSFRDLGVPEGVRQIVARRVSRLSEPAQTVLGLASVFTAGAQVEVLHALSGLAEDELLDALDEALAAGLIRPLPGRDERYDFTHAITRHALYEGRSRARRARLHRQVAEAIERVHGPRAQEHAYELTVQYHASAALPGAENGIPYAILAAERARASSARSEAVAALGLATDLAHNADAATRADVVSRRAVAEADALLLDAAPATIAEALAAHTAADSAPETVAAFLEAVGFALKSNSAAAAVWLPLVRQGIALTDADRGLTWARLHLLLDPIEPVAGTRFKVGIWRGFDQEAVRIAWEQGGEEDHARTLESFDPRTRDETDALLALAKTWSKPIARMRGLTVAANDLQYRHGAFQDAIAVWEEIRAESERHGAISWQANALFSMTFLHVAAGDFANAQESAARANALLARLGPYREPDILAMEMATSLAWYQGGATATQGRFWLNVVTDAPPGSVDFSHLAGPLYAAMAASVFARAGAEEHAAHARQILAELTPLLQRTIAEMGNQNQNGAVGFAASAVWDLNERHLAPAYLNLAQDLLSSGIGDYPQTTLTGTIARMAALQGDMAKAATAFAETRALLDASGQRPLRAIIDLDEALALVRAKANTHRANELLDAAHDAFLNLGLDSWAARARAVRASLGANVSRPIFPAGLTEREIDVLRLVGRGYSDRQISDELYISPRTVNAHLRNMFAKADVNNRTELSVWAAAQGLLAIPE